MVVKEYLDSDRVNFLVWRYLLESNYRETAARFQKEWHISEPHQEFNFAPHVKGHALVSVINRGLVYQALERQRRSQLHQGASIDSESGIFGPLVTQAPAKLEDDGTANQVATTSKAVTPEPQSEADGPTEITARPDQKAPLTAPTVPTVLADDTDVSRKRVRNQLSTENAIKRPRLSNGYENGPESSTTPNTNPMEIESHDNQHQQQQQQQQQQQDNLAYPSPLEGEQASTPVPHTDGPDQGTQVDTVEELLAETTFIRLSDPDRRDNEALSPASTGASNAPILLQCEWNPKDPTMLAAAGTDALARVWTVPEEDVPQADDGNERLKSKGLPLLDFETPLSTTVTALAWSSDGAVLAVATDSGSRAAIKICSSDGVLVQTLSPSDPPIVKLCWNPSNTALLAISPVKTGALITVYYAKMGNSLSYVVANHEILTTPLDATWTSDSEFLLGGGDMLISLACGETSIVEITKLDTKEDDSFTQVLFDSHSQLAATASDKGVLDLWDETGQRRSITAHQGAITTMAWQPLTVDSTSDDERLIATGGEDCAILIWNARNPESKARCYFTMDSPIVRLAFTPDGSFLAGATSSQVLIWKVGSTGMPRATWRRPPHPGWLSPRAGSDSDEEDEHCLCWDASGKKLAYGSNSRLAVINFRR